MFIGIVTAVMEKAVTSYHLGACPEGSRRLHLNEYRCSPHPDVRAALDGAVKSLSDGDLLSAYPSFHQRLLARLKRFTGIPSISSVIPTAGSDELLRAVLDAYCDQNESLNVLVGLPSYTHFLYYARLKKLAIHTYTILDRDIHDGGQATEKQIMGQLDLIETYADLLERGCLVYLGNPNNPVGSHFTPATQERLRALTLQYPKSWFLIDEAYIEFAAAVDEPTVKACQAMSMAMWAATTNNVIVARTFSKAFGLAALRIGYGIVGGEGEPSHTVHNYVTPKALGRLPAVAACAALKNADYYLINAMLTMRRGKAMCAATGKSGILGGGNFSLVHFPQYESTDGDIFDELPDGDIFDESPDGDGLPLVALKGSNTEAFADRGITVRDRHEHTDLKGYLRISYGTAEDCELAIGVIATIPQIHPDPVFAFHTPKWRIAQMRRVLAKAIRLLNGFDVPFWAESGTLLGAARHKGILPWDDDIDLAYILPSSDEDPLCTMVDTFELHGLKLVRNRTDAYWQVHEEILPEWMTRGLLPDELAIACDPVIDILPYALRDGKYRCVDPRFEHEVPDSTYGDCNTSYTPEELLPLSTLPFYHGTIPCPHLHETPLDRALGPNWRTTARIRTKRSANAPGSERRYEYRMLTLPLDKCDVSPA